MEEQDREFWRLLIKDAVREGITPLEKRIDKVETRQAWIGGFGAAAGIVGGWLFGGTK